MRGGHELNARQVRHAGLWLDKIAHKEELSSAPELIKPATTVYKLAFGRWRAYWEAQGEWVVCADGRVCDRLAIGLGAKGVLDNGLRLQFTYGAPLIPGSSLKGILRRSLPETHRNSKTNPKNVEWYLFGGEDWEGAARFHDAWWIPREGEAAFDLDVMTPHHQDYIAGKGPPTDFDEPVPVPFLTVRGTFLFVVETPSERWRDYVKALLKDTLGRDGAGAKRAAGYGRIALEAEPH